ncbi:MAG: N-formylglutamate amidohydrolase [Alphaproteobacteria bacterium]|nr:N-formylglutamate amidohydrolase [Alphaproteobacteria bacterium]
MIDLLMYHIANVLSLTAPNHKTLPIIYDSPHSGSILPTDFTVQASNTDIKQSEDNFVDMLFSQAPQHHAFLLKALFSRIYIDLNRDKNDIDSNLIEPALNNIGDTRYQPSDKSDAGHGLIWKKTNSGVMLYNKLLKPSDIQHRIENYWQPYHHLLERLYRKLYRQFNYVLHLNCHSMPSSALGSSDIASDIASNIDIILGDGYGQTSHPAINDFLQESFTKQDFKVRMNVPYSGGYIVQNYANPNNACYAVQIEINRALYMDEQKLIPNNNFTIIKQKLQNIMQDIANYVESEIHHESSYAAE